MRSLSFTMTMRRNPVQITSLILCLSSFAYAQVISSQPTTNWGSRIAGIVVGSFVLLAIIALCFARGRRRQWRTAPTFIRRTDKPESTLPYWQGTHPYGPPPSGPPPRQPSSNSYGYNAQPAPPPYTKESEGATAPHYGPPPGPPPPAHTRETNHF